MKKKIARQVYKTVLLLFLTMIPFMQASAQSAKVTLNMKNVPMEQVMNEIEKQTSYLFAANDDADLSRKVTVHLVEEPLKLALDYLVAGVPLKWEVSGSTIFLTRRSEEGPGVLSGRVTDENGAGLPGVSVYVKGTVTGTMTSEDGTFTLEVPEAHLSGELEFNSLGYQVQSFPIGERMSFEVVLQPDSELLEQSVVTALGIRRDQKALSYNVQEVRSDMVTTVKDANFINSLAGKVAGVTINSSSSGVGGASKVVLRGNKSISQSSNALYVIDGIPMYNFGGGGGTEFDSKGATESIADLNPEDIESISVLTGAAAAALYGSDAANGAVMITTKKGRAGKLNATFSSNTEFMTTFVTPEFQNRYGTGLNGKDSGSGVYSWGARIPENARNGYNPQDYFKTGHVYTNSLSLSGGTDRNQTYFSAAAVNSDGIIPNNGYDRYNFTFRNTSYFLKEKLRLDASASYIRQYDRNMTNQGVYSNPLTSAYLFPRGEDFDLYRSFERYNPATKMMEQFWSDDLAGDLRMQNPYWINYRNLRETEKKRYMMSMLASYDILPWLNITGRVRIDNANSLYTQKLYATSDATITEGGSNGHYTESRGYDAQTYADIIANFDHTFANEVSLMANIGGSINDISTDAFSYRGPIQANGLANVFNVMDLDDVKKRAEKSGWHDQTISAFASLELGWKKGVFVTLTGRYDMASQLAGSSSKGFFYPSAGLSWVPTEFWNMGALSYMKFRGSVASVGLPFPRFLTMPTYEYDPTSKIWQDKTHYPISDLKPERTLTYEVGADFRLWHDLSISATWYMADTYNQTFDAQLPPSSSYSTIYLQTGHVRNTGIEASVGYDHTWDGFNWNTGFTFSWNRNEIMNLADNAVNPVTGESLELDALEITGLGKVKYILKKGGTLGDIYTSSDLMRNENGYIEVNDNGEVAVIDNGESVLLGSVFPEYNLAWRNGFNWKGVNLGILFSGRIGGVCYSATQANLDLYGVSEASASARDTGGVLVNGRQMVEAQKWYQTVGSQSGLPQYYTYSATNFRLQELSLGYTLPRKWFKDKMGLTISFVGHNLWMIYCKAPFDPEAVASTGNNYQGIDYFMMPSLRRLGFNVKLDF